MCSILDLLYLVMEEGQQIKRKKLMQAVRKHLKSQQIHVVGLFQCHYRKKSYTRFVYKHITIDYLQ